MATHHVDVRPQLARLANGARVAVLPMPWRQTVSLSVFVRTGSQHESRRLNGISHLIEHMAFKGTVGRDCQRINLDAERLGAEVDAHTDRDHTAFHIEGLARDLDAFVPMLADIVLHPTFPEEELERERQVIEHEFIEFEDDSLTIAFALFDRALFGSHPVAQPVIGTRANLRRFTRQDLLDRVARQYTAANLVVAVAGPVDAARFLRLVERAFGVMPAGQPHHVDPPAAVGGVKTRRLGGSTQCHAVLGYAVPGLGGDHLPYVLAAAMLGEGMSSPLLDEIRERRGLAYHVASSVDLGPLAGQFVIEATTAPDQVLDYLAEVMRLLRAHARRTDAVALERARRQLAVRVLRSVEQPARRLEAVMQEWCCLGRPRSPAQALRRLQAVTPAQVRQAFASMLASPAAVALAGGLPARAGERVRDLVGL
jgi:predicted Zn-dependent peptidase